MLEYLWNCFTNILIKINITERKNRTKLSLALDSIPYICNYIIISQIILFASYTETLAYANINSNIMLYVQYSLLGIRIFIAIAYILLQKQHLLILNKILLAIDIFIIISNKSLVVVGTSSINLVIDLCISILWSLTRQLRQQSGNLDARLYLFPFWMKQAILALIVFTHTVLHDTGSQQGTSIVKQNSIILPFMLLHLYFNTRQFLYEIKFKVILISCDLSLILVSILRIILNFSISLLQMAAIMSFIVGITSWFIYRRKVDYSYLYFLDQKVLNIRNVARQLQIDQLIEYFFLINYMVRSSDFLQINKFVKNHRSICFDHTCPILYEQDDIKMDQKNTLIGSQSYLIKIVSLYLDKQMLKLKNFGENFRKYLFFRMLPSSKIFLIINDSNFFERRQLKRMADHHIQSYQNYEAKLRQYETQQQHFKTIIMDYLANAERFFTTILKKKLLASSLISTGRSLLQSEKKILAALESNQKMTSLTRMKLNKFLSYILVFQNQKLLPQISDPIYVTDISFKSKPLLVISAEGTDFSTILSVTKQFAKLFYFSIQYFVGLKIEHLVPAQLRAAHTKKIEYTLGKSSDFTGFKSVNNNIFINNSFGYMVNGTMTIHRLQGISTRKWIIEFIPLVFNEALIAITGGGKLIGINQNSVRMGFDPSMVGKQIANSVLMHLQKYPEKIVLKFDESIFLDGTLLKLKSDTGFILQKQWISEQLSKVYMISVLASSATTTSISFKCSQPLKKTKCIPINDFKFKATQKGKYKNYTLDQLESQNDQQTSLTKKNISLSLKTLKHKTVKSESILFKEKSPLQQHKQEQQIQQMVYRNGIVDYKSNIAAQLWHDQDFPVVVCKLKETDFKIDKRIYLESIQNIQKRNPFWLKTIRVIIFLHLLFQIILLSSTLVLDYIEIMTRNNRLDTMSLISMKMFKFARLGSIPIIKNYDTNYDIEDQFTKLINNVQDISEQIYLKDSQISYYMNVNITNQDNDHGLYGSLSEMERLYLLAFNHYLNALVPQKISILQYLIRAIFPGYRKVVNNIYDIYINRSSFNSFAIFSATSLSFIVLLIFSLLFLIFVCQISKNESQLLQFFKQIKNDVIESQMYKIKKFCNYVCEDCTKVIEPQQCKELNNEFIQQKTIDNIITEAQPLKSGIGSNLQKQNKSNYKKNNNNGRILNIQSDDACFNKKKVINNNFKLSLCLTIAILFAIYLTMISSLIFQTFNEAGKQQEQLKYIKALFMYSTSANMIWVSLNQFPQNKTIIDNFEEIMLQSQQDFRNSIFEGFRKNYFSQDLVLFYEKFWDEDCCIFLKQKITTCKTDIEGSLSEGMEQGIAFISRKFDYMMHNPMPQVEFIKQKDARNTLIFVDRYFPLILEIMSQKIITERHQQSKIGSIILVISFTTCILITIMGSIFFWIGMSRQKNKMIQIQRLLIKFDFESMIEIPMYNKFVRSKIQQRMS